MIEIKPTAGGAPALVPNAEALLAVGFKPGGYALERQKEHPTTAHPEAALRCCRGQTAHHIERVAHPAAKL